MQIIDFLRNFTVDVQGVGDVCSFAQLDIAKHGDLKERSKCAFVASLSHTQTGSFASGSLLFAPSQRTHRMLGLPMTVNLSCPSCTSTIRIRNGKCRSSAKCTWKRFKNEVCPYFAHHGTSFSFFACLAVENMPTSSILQQSLNDMQTLNAQQSFYSDPLCRNFLGCSNIVERHSCISLSL